MQKDEKTIAGLSASEIEKQKSHNLRNNPLFGKQNYQMMLVGAVILALGFILMAGGKSSDPNVFDESSVYSFRRITLAPALLIIGFIVMIIAIMRKSKVD